MNGWPAIASGVLLAGALAWVIRRHTLTFVLRFWAVGLAVAAGLYVAFALRAPSAPGWLMVELGGLALFTLVALVALRTAPWLLAVGWMAHIAWDVGLHGTPAAPHVPAWYPPLCIGFDLMVAVLITGLLRTRRRSGSETFL